MVRRVRLFKFRVGNLILLILEVKMKELLHQNGCNMPFGGKVKNLFNRIGVLASLLVLVVVMATATGKENYLIITESKYKDNADLKEFITFREALFNVSVTTVSEAGGSADGIKSYIKNMYDGTGSLSYVLMVGRGKSGIPCFNKNSSNTYHPYGDMKGDTKLEVAVGCFFVRSATDLKNIITKTMYTEKNIDTYPKTQIQFSVYASNDQNLVRLCGIMRDRYWEKPVNELTTYETSWMVPTRSEGSGKYKSDFMAAVNGNKATFIAYQGHGSQTAWTDRTSVTSSDVNGLSNDKVYPFIFSHACVTGSFHSSSKCFGETWTTGENGGVAFYGASVNSSYYQKIFNAGTACGIAQHPEIHRLGDLFIFAKNFVRDTTIPGFNGTGFGNPNKADENMYNLFGDPALEFRKSPSTPIYGNMALNKPSKGIAIYSVNRNNLNFSTTKAGTYRIVITTVNGRQVAQVNEYVSTVGKHMVNLGSSLSTGVYLIKINGNRMQTIKKLSVMN